MPKIKNDEPLEWYNYKTLDAYKIKSVPEYLSIIDIDILNEDPYYRKLRMLRQLSSACTACSMCPLGYKVACNNYEQHDPHVFSSLNPTRFMIICLKPNWNETRLRRPFLNDHFFEILGEYGLDRSDFYITNLVKCYSVDDVNDYISKCSSFIDIEINMIDPLLIVSTDEESFKYFSDDDYNISFGKITKSKNRNIFTVGSDNDIIMLAKLVCALKEKHSL